MSDLFSKQAKLYAQYRPKYPQPLYDFILSQCNQTHFAWDCATGNGQVALKLAETFDKVLATDISAEQIKNAPQKSNLEYQVISAEEKLNVPNQSFDLITVAQALHWTKLETFYQEVQRTLKPGGIFAAWGYGFHEPITPEIDKILNHFYFETLGKYWKPNNHLLWEGYKTIPFPFDPIPTPEFKMTVEWSLMELLGYFSTWSATQLYKDETKTDPIETLVTTLLPLWGELTLKKELSWKLSVRLGRLGPKV